MTSYDDRDNRYDLDPAYGIHLHDPRMMEYMGAPESARLLGRSPEYWLEHMGRDRLVAAALRLHHDASLIMTNVQGMSQFVTSLNRTVSEVMRTVYAREPFPTDAVHFVTPGRQSPPCGTLNEITLKRIVGFRWDDPGTELEDEMPTPVLSRTAFRMPRSDELTTSRAV